MCFGARTKDEQDSRSRELDRIIRQDERRMSREVKLLLLGRRNFCPNVGDADGAWTASPRPPGASITLVCVQICRADIADITRR